MEFHNRSLWSLDAVGAKHHITLPGTKQDAVVRPATTSLRYVFYRQAGPIQSFLGASGGQFSNGPSSYQNNHEGTRVVGFNIELNPKDVI